MPRPYTPTVGDRVIVVQEYERPTMLDGLPTVNYVTNEILGVVHYVRKRGDYQIDLASGRRYWVDAAGWVREDSLAGTARVRGLV